MYLFKYYSLHKSRSYELFICLQKREVCLIRVADLLLLLLLFIKENREGSGLKKEIRNSRYIHMIRSYPKKRKMRKLLGQKVNWFISHIPLL